MHRPWFVKACPEASEKVCQLPFKQSWTGAGGAAPTRGARAVGIAMNGMAPRARTPSSRRNITNPYSEYTASQVIFISWLHVVNL
jgi:hypothetical protein